MIQFRLISRTSRCLSLLFVLSVLITSSRSESQKEGPTPKVPHVIQIGVDAGGGFYLVQFLKDHPDDFKNIQRLIDEGASTLNARTDYFITITQPNFTCMVTGRPAQGLEGMSEDIGHHWLKNWDLREVKSPESIHDMNPGKQYLSSVFDVIHDAGFTTGLYWAPNKFYYNILLSYGSKFGKEGPHGRNKIDVEIGSDVAAERLATLQKGNTTFSFLYFPDCDKAGHRFGYLSQEYLDAFKKVDGYVGDLLKIVDTDPEWNDRTVIILTGDHGGKPPREGHGDITEPKVYTVPLIVWGKDVAKGADLYELNKDSRKNPGDTRPEYGEVNQPIRNGDTGNLVLSLLGLPPIPGSYINHKQDLKVR